MWIRVLVGLHHQNGVTRGPGDEFWTENPDFLKQHGTDKFVEVHGRPDPTEKELEEDKIVDDESASPVQRVLARREKSKAGK